MPDTRSVGGFITALTGIAFLLWIVLGTGTGIGIALSGVKWWVWLIALFIFVIFIMRKK